jgi:fermentation-respiration switch protein FrsA (DUF1100 family)
MAEKKRFSYYLRRIPMYLAVAYFTVVACAYFMQSSLLFFPSQEMQNKPSQRGWKYEEIMLDVPGGKTCGWYLPLDNARGVVLFSHGNGDNISSWFEVTDKFRKLGFSTLLYDYASYGKSTGKISEKRCYADVRAMWNWLIEVKKIPPEKILIYGQSFGGGVAADLAKDVKPGAVVLESTFTSVPDIAARQYPFLPVRLLCSFQFDTKNKMAQIHAPIMIIHSPDDTLIPYSNGETLFKLANEPKTFLKIGGDHNSGFGESKDVYLKGWEEFVGPLFPK